MKLNGVALTESGRKLSRVVELELVPSYDKALKAYFESKDLAMTGAAGAEFVWSVQEGAAGQRCVEAQQPAGQAGRVVVEGLAGDQNEVGDTIRAAGGVSAAVLAARVSAAVLAARVSRDPSTFYRELLCPHLQRPGELARQHGLAERSAHPTASPSRQGTDR